MLITGCESASTFAITGSMISTGIRLRTRDTLSRTSAAAESGLRDSRKRTLMRLRSGRLKIYVKTGDSGTRRLQSFCPECGTSIHATTEGEGPKVHSVRIGSIRQRNELVPKSQIWCRSSLRWVSELGSIARHETQPGFSQTGGIA